MRVLSFSSSSSFTMWSRLNTPSSYLRISPISPLSLPIFTCELTSSFSLLLIAPSSPRCGVVVPAAGYFFFLAFCIISSSYAVSSLSSIFSFWFYSASRLPPAPELLLISFSLPHICLSWCLNRRSPSSSISSFSNQSSSYLSPPRSWSIALY